MKNKKFGIAAVLLSVAWVVAALAVGLNTYDGNTYQTLLAPTADTGVGSTGTAVNVGPYEGIATILFSCTKNVDSNGTNVITLQSATASAGTYSTVTNLAGTAVQLSQTLGTGATNKAIKLDLGAAHAWVRAVNVPQSATGTTACVIILPPKGD